MLQVSELRQLDGLLLKPQVALTVSDREPFTQIQKVIRGAPKTVPLFLEIRIDCFRRWDNNSILQRIHTLRKLGLPLIATIRSKKEGGRKTLSDSRRLELFKSVLPSVQMIDVELASNRLRERLIPLAHRKGKKVILSYHNFCSTPSEKALTLLMKKAKRAGADWIKIAVTAQKKSDVARLLLFTQHHRNQNLITLSMGKLGQPSRVLGFLFGSRLTYSFIGRAHAPGQLAFPEFLRELKSLQID